MKHHKNSLKRAMSYWQHSGLGPSLIKWNKISIALAKVMKDEKDKNLNEILKWHEDIKKQLGQRVYV